MFSKEGYSFRTTVGLSLLVIKARFVVIALVFWVDYLTPWQG